jgi:hypothetical protein
MNRVIFTLCLLAVLICSVAAIAQAFGVCQRHPQATCDVQGVFVDPSTGRLYTKYHCTCGDTVYVAH